MEGLACSADRSNGARRTLKFPLLLVLTVVKPRKAHHWSLPPALVQHQMKQLSAIISLYYHLSARVDHSRDSTYDRRRSTGRDGPISWLSATSPKTLLRLELSVQLDMDPRVLNVREKQVSYRILMNSRHCRPLFNNLAHMCLKF